MRPPRGYGRPGPVARRISAVSQAVAAVPDRTASARRAAPLPERAPVLTVAPVARTSTTNAEPVVPRVEARATTRDRVRAAVAAAPTAGPATAGSPTTRDRVAAALAPPAAREQEQEPRGGRQAVVADLAARRTTGGAAAGSAADRATLASVVPIGPQAGQQEPGREAAPARATETGERPVRGPPPGGPAAPDQARSSQSQSAAAPAAATPGRVVVLTDRRAAKERAPPAAGHGRDAPGADGAAPAPAESAAVLAFRGRVAGVGARTVAHTRGKPSADNAQLASRPDLEREVAGQAAGNRVTSMESAATDNPVTFDAATFKADVKVAVEKIAPPDNLAEADRFAESGKAGEAAGVARTLVKGGQVATQQPIATSTAAPPDKRGIGGKPVGDLVNDPVGRGVTTAGAAAVLPGPRPEAAVDFSAGPRGVDDTMTAQGITVGQLSEANEPRFAAALDARQAVADHAAAATPAYRGDEATLLPAAATALGGQETVSLFAMNTARVGSLRDARGIKDHTRNDDQQRRNNVSQALLDIHRETKGSVEGILKGLDATVTTMFTEGEADARYMFEHYVAYKMDVYKDDRYGGLGGGALWLKDKFFDLPGEVNEFYRTGRDFYLNKLERTIDAIAVVIGASLAMATLVIRFGRLRVQHLLTTLPTDLVQLGVETAAELDQRFDLLATDVSSARDHLVDVVARAYVDSTTKLDGRITELQEANKGLATRAIEFAEEIGHTIAELGRLLARVIVKAVSVIGSIIAHPIRFFGHLIDAIGAGISLFAQHIGKHLEDALLDLLFGDLGKTGITLPDSLDFAGLFDLVCQVLQIRWVDLRGRLVDKIGLPAVLHLERVADVFMLLVDKGVGGLWELAMKKLSELPGLVIGALKTYVIEQVVKAGIQYVVALLTPAGAFIKACQGIYRLLSFIVDKAKQIGDFIDAVLDSIGAIADGDTAAAAEKIDAALAGALKLALGFLGKLAHLDAIADKARAVIEAIRAPVRRVVDSIIDAAINLARSAGSLGRRTQGVPAAVDAPAHAPPMQQPADPASIALTQPLSMDHAQHTLTFKVIGGHPEVIMASERAAYLQSVAASAFNEEKSHGRRADLLDGFKNLEEKLADLKFDYEAAEFSKDDAEKRHQIKGGLEQIASVLSWMGQEFKIKNLEHLQHASSYALPGGLLKDGYIGKQRRHFYPSGYIQVADTWRRTQLALLRRGAPSGTFKDESSGTFEPLQRPSASGQRSPESNVTIDHQPRVMEHWNGHSDVPPPGRESGQKARSDFYNDTSPGKLQLVSWSHNSIDGALAKATVGGYAKTVGTDFTGPDDE